MKRGNRSGYNPLMRCIATLVSFALVVSIVLAAPLQARADSIRAAKSSLDAANAAARYSAPKSKPRLIPAPKSLKENLKPLSATQIAKLRMKSKSSPIVPVSITLLDPVGHLTQRSPTAVEINRSAEALATGSKVANAKAFISAYTHLIHGELLLAHDEQPGEAGAEFQIAARLATGSSRAAQTIREIANYDRTFALFYSGQYQPAADHLQNLLKSKRAFAAVSRRDAALFLSHVRACAGYHSERTKAGIVEPTRIAPLCGIEAIAGWLRANGRPYDKKTVLPTCRVTGEGSNLADLERAADKLGLHHYVFGADTEGLKALPSVLVAYVEHDHFVAVTHADTTGVTYLCADCGLWPGGAQHVTWKQWRMMEAGPYMALAKPGSDTDEALKLASAAAQNNEITSREVAKTRRFETPAATGLRLASAEGQAVSAATIMRLAARLKGHVLLDVAPLVGVTCGSKLASARTSCPVCHPEDGAGPVKKVASVGPSGGDPVELATGEEQYEPDTDLSVYNPIGPSVTFSRIYNSLRPAGTNYNSDDFGIGWSHSLNFLMYDPTTKPITRYQQGSTNTSISSQGNDAPGSGLHWDVVQNGVTIASSSTTNGWSASNTGSEGQNINLTIPSGAAIGHDYEIRTSGGVTYFSAFFDVYATTSNGQVPAGGSATISFTGTDAPASGLAWDVIESGTTVATSTVPNGWALSTTGVINSDTVTAPAASAQTTYEVRYAHGGYYGNSPVSSYIQVYPVDYNPKTGARYLIEPNGAQVVVTANAIPTATAPSVTCVLPAGYPMIVTWNYLATNTCGFYIITFANRTQMVTSSSAAKMVGSGTAFLFQVGQIIDQSGNSIYLNYGAAGTGGFPMLASITDTNGAALVTFSRTAGSGNLTAINDRYGRSVYYSVGTFATENVPTGYTQSYQEVDQVSQIVPTGSGSPPNRYAYGYQDVANGEGSEEVPFLHTITVPSPTGTGNATSTINYATNGTCCVSSTVDANGNSHIYSATNEYTTLVTIEDSHSNVDYSYSVTFDANMSETGITNGTGVYQIQSTFGDPNDPYRPSEVTNANGNTSYATWDEYGNCLTSTSARGTVTMYTMSYTNFALGEVTQVAEGAKTPSTMSYYEPSGLLQTANVPAPGTASNGATAAYSWIYDGLGNVLSETGPGNAVTATITTTLNYTTDGGYSQNAAIGQPLTQTDNLGHVTHMRFDGQANLLNVTDSLGNVTQQSVNIANQSVTTTFPATGTTGPGNATVTNSYLYPGGPGVSESKSNESGVQVWQVVDTLGPEGEDLAKSGSTEAYSASYDGFYRATSVSDGNSHATQTYYSTAGYAWKTVYPNGDTFEYTSFDAIGDPLQRVDGRAVVTNYSYTDPESRLTNVQYPASTSINVTLSYDQYGRTTGVTDGSGTHSYVLDDLGNILIDTTTYTGLPALSLTSHYNPDGSRSLLSLPDGSTFSYQFDAGARPTGLTGAGGQSWGWSYLNNNWIAQQNAASQVITTPTYNAWGATINLSNNLNNIPLTLLSNYQVGFAANLTLGAVTANMPAAPSAFSGSTSYTHDSKIELTNETSGRGGGYNFSSAFDGAGNPTTFKGASNSFNSANQNTANGYDGNGNPTTYNGNTLTFDAENRMTAYGSVMAAGYRADGLRAWKQNSSGTTYFLYDGNELVEEVNSSGSAISKMTWGPTGLLARTTSSRTLLYTTDAIGQVAQQVDASSGSIVASYLFDAWGARQVSTSDPTAASDPFSGYNTEAGYYTDWETGLQLLGHRYYDPTAGRFLNRDPIGMAGGINVYGYCGNGPLDRLDPSGLASIKCDGKTYHRHVGDPDLVKGWPHWDCGGDWIGNDGWVRRRNGKKGKVSKQTERQIQKEIDKAEKSGCGDQLQRPKDSTEPPFKEPAPAPNPWVDPYAHWMPPTEPSYYDPRYPMPEINWPVVGGVIIVIIAIGTGQPEGVAAGGVIIGRAYAY